MRRSAIAATCVAMAVHPAKTLLGKSPAASWIAVSCRRAVRRICSKPVSRN